MAEVCKREMHPKPSIIKVKVNPAISLAFFLNFTKANRTNFPRASYVGAAARLNIDLVV